MRIVPRSAQAARTCPGRTLPSLALLLALLAGQNQALATAVPPQRELGDITGLSQEQVVELIGPPDHAEDDALVRTWTYADDDCAIRVMFFREVGSATYHALHAEAAPTRPAEPCTLARLASGGAAS